MSRRSLRGIHTTMARKQGVNAAAWFVGQSFTSASRGDLPLTRMTDKQLNEAGAGLLPKAREVCPDCLGSGETLQHVTDNRVTRVSCPECHGRGYYAEEQR